MVGFVGDLTGDYAQLRACLLADPACSNWLKEALRSLEDRDPVDAVNDTEVLLKLTQTRLQEILGSLRCAR